MPSRTAPMGLDCSPRIRQTTSLGLPTRLIRAAMSQGLTIAVAESLTGGLLSAALVESAGSSAAFRGGVIAYATDLKVELLGVEADLLQKNGPVDPQVARTMAREVAIRLGADIGIATTGVAGPASQGEPVGTVYIACSKPEGQGEVVRHYNLPGSRHIVRNTTVNLACALGLGVIGEQN